MLSGNNSYKLSQAVIALTVFAFFLQPVAANPLFTAGRIVGGWLLGYLAAKGADQVLFGHQVNYPALSHRVKKAEELVGPEHFRELRARIDRQEITQKEYERLSRQAIARIEKEKIPLMQKTIDAHTAEIAALNRQMSQRMHEIQSNRTDINSHKRKFAHWEKTFGIDFDRPSDFPVARHINGNRYLTPWGNEVRVAFPSRGKPYWDKLEQRHFVLP